MARPTGRYFASVIAKIRDAKKKEQIVVDDGFRLQLRQQLMMKISAQVQPQKISWAERLMPFKSYLAVVPALAFVIVAVVGISHLPIALQSNVVIPVANFSQQTSAIRPLGENTSSLINLQSQSANNNTPTIKTFPGRLVIPIGGFNNTTFSPQSLETNVVAPTESPVAGSPPVQVLQPKQAQASTNEQPLSSSGYVAAPYTYTPPQQNNSLPDFSVTAPAVQQPQQVQQNSGYVAAPIFVSASPSEDHRPVQTTVPAQQFIVGAPVSTPPIIVPATAPVVVNTSTTFGSVTTVAVNQDNVANVVANQAAIPVPVTSVALATVAAPQTTAVLVAPAVGTASSAYVQKVEPAGQVSNTTRLNTNVVAKKIAAPSFIGFNQMAILPPRQLDFNVYYNGDFSTDEHTLFEQNLLPSLVQNGTVSFAYVYQKNASTIRIEIHLNNGNVQYYDYTLDANGIRRLTLVSQNAN